MLFNSLKLNIKKDIRVLQTDNNSAFFSLSDFNGELDGLWSEGCFLFKSLFIDSANNKIEKKTHSFYGTMAQYSKKFNINFCLFKNNGGFLIEINNKSLNLMQTKSYELYFKIDCDYGIIEKNINTVVIEYLQDSSDYGYKKYYCSFAINKDHIIDNVQRENDYLKFTVKSLDNSGGNCSLYLYYNSDYDSLKKTTGINISRIEALKTDLAESADRTLKNANPDISDSIYNKAVKWSLHSAQSFIINKDNFTGIWAGYPWFNNFWGRDTFISLSGICLVTGRFNTAKRILASFSDHQCRDNTRQEDGRLPNVINNLKMTSYNSADVTPLFIRSAYEYLLYTGDSETIIELWDKIKYAVDNAYFKNKDKNSLIKHQDAEDWMDAKKDGKRSYSPRSSYAAEIQALWYTALFGAGLIAKYIYRINKTKEYLEISKKYTDEALKLKESFNKYFINSEPPFIADHLKDGYKKSDEIRPNALLAVFFAKMPGIPSLIDQSVIIKHLSFILPELIYPDGVGTLSRNSRLFHPMHINKMHHKDASYHNGLIWLWLSGPLVSAMCGINMHDFIFNQTKNISEQLLNAGTAGTLPELSNAAGPFEKIPHSSGAYSQAWSIAEFNRSLFQDYLGITMNIPDREILLNPKMPVKLESVKTVINFGNDEKISLSIKNNSKSMNISSIEIRSIDLEKPVFLNITVYKGRKDKYEESENKYISIRIKMSNKDDSFQLNFNGINARNLISLNSIKLNRNSEIISVKNKTAYTCLIDGEKFVFSPYPDSETFKNIKSLSEKNYLESILKI